MYWRRRGINQKRRKEPKAEWQRWIDRKGKDDLVGRRKLYVKSCWGHSRDQSIDAVKIYIYIYIY
jgi:hypothetical protein